MKSRFPVQIYPETCRGSVSGRIKKRQCHAEEEGKKNKKKNGYSKVYMPTLGRDVKKGKGEKPPQTHTKKSIRLFSQCDLIK